MTSKRGSMGGSTLLFRKNRGPNGLGHPFPLVQPTSRALQYNFPAPAIWHFWGGSRFSGGPESVFGPFFGGSQRGGPQKGGSRPPPKRGVSRGVWGAPKGGSKPSPGYNPIRTYQNRPVRSKVTDF